MQPSRYLRTALCCLGLAACAADDAATSDSGVVPVTEAPEAATTSELMRAHQGTFGTDLSVVLDGPTEAAVAERIDLTVTVINHGPKEPLDYHVDVELTSHLQFRSSSANCQEYRPTGGLSCSRLPRLEVGGAFSATITVDVIDGPTDGDVRMRSKVYPSTSWITDTDTSNDATERVVSVTP